MKEQLFRFVIRWFVCSFGLWVAAGLLGQSISYDSRFRVIIIAGFLLALVNAVVKPIIVVLSMPAILFSLGLFMIVINGLTVLIVSKLYPSLEINGFGAAMIAGIVIGLVNYLVSLLVEKRKSD